MTSWLDHLPIFPIAIPLVAAAIMLLLRDTQRRARLLISIVSLVAQFAVALVLFGMVLGNIDNNWVNGVGVYLLGDWPAPFGIVVVVDRLTTIMLMLAILLGGAAWVYSTARWDRAGVHFHPLFQFLLMGLNGAFLTGDLFNLFVFFEVMLVASYGLMLHGSGRERVGSSLHYIAVNLVSSFLMLIGLAIIYGLCGTLNMADLVVQAAQLSGPDRRLFDAGAAILGIAYLIKAAAWPLNFWLPAAYGNASPPVAGMFAIMTKVGLYTLVRIGSLLVPSGAPATFSGDWMFAAGIITLMFASIGVLATTQVQRQAGYAVIMSSGLLLAAFGMPDVALTGPALFYMSSSVVAMGAFFMLIEMVSRTQPFGAELLAISQDVLHPADEPDPFADVDETAGVTIPAAMAFLGLSFFACALVITGLPPFSGFIGKFAMLSAALNSPAPEVSTAAPWILLAAALTSGLLALIALCRTGIRMFWATEDLTVPTLLAREAGPVAALILACAGMVVCAGPLMEYMQETARYLGQPMLYVDAVLSQHPVNPAKLGE